MEIFAVFFVAGQSGNTKVECGGGIGKEAQTAFKKRRCRESKGTVQERGRKDSENGEPRNIRTPRGSGCSKNGVGTQRGGLSFLRATLPLSAREFCHLPHKFRFPHARTESFSAGTKSVREFLYLPHKLRLTAREFCHYPRGLNFLRATLLFTAREFCRMRNF